MTDATRPKLKAADLPALDIIDAYGLDDSYHLGTALELMLRIGHSGQVIAHLTIARQHVLRFAEREHLGFSAAPNAHEDALALADPDEIVAAYGLTGRHAEAVLALLAWCVFGLDPVLDAANVESECALIVRHIDAAIRDLAMVSA